MSTQKKRRKQQNNTLFLLILILIALIVIMVYFVFAEYRKSKETANDTVTTTTTMQKSSDDEITTSSQNESAADSTIAEDESTSDGETTVEGETTTANEAFDKNTFFKDALFIGDSRTQGFQMHSGITSLGATIYAHAGLTVDELDSLSFVTDDDGSTKTVAQALNGKTFKKVFVMQGLNELGWPSATGFAESYDKFIKQIQEILPDATIYVQSIIQVTKEKSDNHEYFTKDNVDAFNAEVKKLCDGTKVIWLDVNPELIDSNGYLKDEYGSDGIHMVVSGYQKWLDEIIAFFSK